MARKRKPISIKYFIWINFGLKLTELLESTPTFGKWGNPWRVIDVNICQSRHEMISNYAKTPDKPVL